MAQLTEVGWGAGGLWRRWAKVKEDDGLGGGREERGTRTAP